MEIKSITKSNFNYFYSLLEKDFCFEERKTKDAELKAFSNPLFKPYFIYKEEQIVGYICLWEFDKFIFGEHFAILEGIRNTGIGSEFLNTFLPTLSKPFIFEVERPSDEISKKRISFYIKNKIIINDHDYYQPSYHNGDDKVPMFIASYPNSISHTEFLECSQSIKDIVYKQ